MRRYFKRVTVERRKRGLTQRGLADELDTHLSNIAKIENGTFIPLPSSLLVKRLERFFQLPLDELLTDIDPSREPIGGRS